MALFSTQQKQTVADHLAAKGANRGCPRCGSLHHSVLPGWVRLNLDATQGPSLASHSLAAIGTSCDQCGYIMLHGILANESLDLGPE
jgi:ribosomal protein S27AE